MKRQKINLILFGGLLIFALIALVFLPQIDTGILLAQEDDGRVIVLTGSPYQRGMTHGKALKNEITELVQLWKKDLNRMTSSDPDSVITRFLEKTDYLSAIRKYTPGLLDEVRGISDGSGIDFNTMLAFQFVDEVWLNVSDVMGEHCSSLGVSRSGENPSMIGQNMDIEGFRNGYQTVLHIKNGETGLETFVFTFAGFIATNGMNNKGIAVCVNAMMQLNYSRTGLPVAFMIRGILESETLEDAVSFLKNADHASPQNYVIGGPERVYDLECSSEKIVPYELGIVPNTVYHTNHPLKNKDYNPRYRKYVEGLGEGAVMGGNSHVRFNSMEARFKALDGTAKLRDLKEILSSRDSDRHPVSRPFIDSSRGFTFGSTIMVLSDEPEFHVSFGPPVVGNYKIFRFSK